MHDELILSPTEEEIIHSNFRGLMPGQIEYPLGPIDERLPFPIYFRFILSGRRILKMQVEIGWLHQGLEKLLEQASPEEGSEIIRRVNPLCPEFAEHYFRLACGLPGKEAEILKAEKTAYHLYFIREILTLLREETLLSLLDVNLESFKSKFLNSTRLKKRLSGLGQISQSNALSYGLTGPSLKACEEPYTGDVWSRLAVKLEELVDPKIDCAPEGEFIVTRRPTRTRIRTPAFAHAAALHVFLKDADLDDLVLIMLSLGLVGTEIDR